MPRDKTRLMPYPEERALEHTAFALGLAPTRIHSVLLPLWNVEIEADVREGEAYELIDHYLERGIAEARLETVAELAAFFALDPPLVGQALRFLTAIGHVGWTGDRLALTALGLESLRDNKRYIWTRNDRRRLYFEAFGSRPLTRPYYDDSKVTLLPVDKALETSRSKSSAVRTVLLEPVDSFFRDSALTELATNPERDRFNLPERIDNPRRQDIGRLYLAAYIVRAVDQRPGSRPRHLVYTPAADEFDPELTAVCESAPEVVGTLDGEEPNAVRIHEQKIIGWLSSRGLAEHEPVKLRDGSWQVTLPAKAFAPGGDIPLAKLGSFVVVGNSFFRLWCKEESARLRAVVGRLEARVRDRANVDLQAFARLAEQISRQLGCAEAGPAALRKVARDLGKTAVADQFDQLIGRG